MPKQKRDAKATQAKILQEARTLFSLKGFDATTTDDIAKSSGVNKALIYYYFKNKAGLYAQVMSGLFDAIYDEVVTSRESCTSTTDELHAFIKTYADYAYEHPYFPALLLRELSDSGAHLPEMMFASMRNLFILLSDILTKAEEQKVFTHAIPMVVHFMIIGSLNLMVTTEPLRKKAMQLDASVDTCSGCSADEVSTYIFETIKKSLEVK
jgi:AcrR family transcriptional regulator